MFVACHSQGKTINNSELLCDSQARHCLGGCPDHSLGLCAQCVSSRGSYFQASWQSFLKSFIVLLSFPNIGISHSWRTRIHSPVMSFTHPSFHPSSFLPSTLPSNQHIYYNPMMGLFHSLPPVFSKHLLYI